MNEINNTSPFFAALEMALNTLIDARVQAQVQELRDLVEANFRNTDTRITELEQSLSARAVQIESLGIDQRDDAKRIDALENFQDSDQLENNRRLVALETGLPAIPQPTVKFDFDSYEFRTAVIKIIDNHTMGDEFLNPLVSALTDNDEFRAAVHRVAKDVAQSEVEEAMDTHNNDYNHDDIHEMSDMDEDAVREIVQESMRDTVNDLLDGATVSIRV
jgi:hypothetical protein